MKESKEALAYFVEHLNSIETSNMHLQINKNYEVSYSPLLSGIHFDYKIETS